MEKIICEGNEIFVENYLEQKRLYALDLKFKSKEEFERFLSIYEKHNFSKGIFRFEIAERHFDGWFGQMLYDENYNVRTYVGIYSENETLDRDDGGKKYSIGKSVLGIGNALRELCNILEENSVLNIEQKNRILHMLNTPETITEFQSLVEDLPLYLKSTHSTIDDIKNGM